MLSRHCYFLCYSEYICTYSGTRSMTCHFRQSMRTGFMEWLLPGVVSGSSAAAGNTGIFGEEMEEVMEQVMESGLPPRPLPSRRCRSCAPLQVCSSFLGISKKKITRNNKQTNKQTNTSKQATNNYTTTNFDV
jgi:hypothetical protein